MTNLFTILWVYLPSCFLPFLRTTGDEKVYIAQTVELAERSSFFIHTMAGDPFYYKGPLLFILYRIGSFVFGTEHMLGLLIFNIVAIWFSSYVLSQFLRKHTELSVTKISYLTFCYVFSISTYAHMAAAQMEILLISCYTLAIVDLVKGYTSGKLQYNFRLFLWIAISSWLKSPIHAVLMTSGYFWVYASLKPSEIRKIHFWLPVFCGTLCGILGYFPAIIWDFEAFWQTYIVHESFKKTANGVGFLDALLPIWTYHLWPLALPAIIIWIRWIKTFCQNLGKTIISSFNHQNLLNILTRFILPTLLFFTLHPFKSPIYLLPCLPAVLIYLFILWPNSLYVRNLVRISLLVQTLVLTILWGFFIFITTVDSLEPLPFWCKVLFAIGSLFLIYTSITFDENSRLKTRQFQISWLGALTLLNICMIYFGHLDFRDLSKYREVLPENAKVAYWNLHRHTFTEWAALNFWINLPTYGIHTQSQLEYAVSENHPILLPNRQTFKDFKRYAVGIQKNYTFRKIPRFSTQNDLEQSKNNRFMKLLKEKKFDGFWKYQWLALPRS